jgi:hypothetical protein
MTKTCNVLKNRAESMNRVHTFVNNMVPLVQERLEQGFKLRVSGTMYQKDKDDVDAIVEAYKSSFPRNSLGHQSMRAYVRCDDYNITLEADDNYPVEFHDDGSRGYTCEYYKVTAYLWDVKEGVVEEYAEREMTSETEMVSAQARLKEIEAQVSELQSERYPLQRLLGG